MHTKCRFGICKKKPNPFLICTKEIHTHGSTLKHFVNILLFFLVIGSTNKACTLPTLTYSTYSKNDSINQQDCFAQWCVV